MRRPSSQRTEALGGAPQPVRTFLNINQLAWPGIRWSRALNGGSVRPSHQKPKGFGEELWANRRQ